MPESGSIYRSIKLAAQLFGKPLESLAPEELQRVTRVAARQQEIETLILETPEAASVMLPAASIDASLTEIRGRYGDDDEYHAELERLGLDASSLRQAVARDLVVEAVLERVAAKSAAVSDTDIEIFWYMNQQRFRHGETRVLRHLLVTINEGLAGNERQAARARIDAIHARLRKEPQRFAEQALKHSECPTAIHGGLLGRVPRGRLYPQLDAVAFSLAEGMLSEVIESELGYHLVRCETIQHERLLSLPEARQTIREHLEGQQQALCQKAWIKALRRQAAERSPDANRK
jgi:peptidyl-prolyl cis-trans isomerase C